MRILTRCFAALALPLCSWPMLAFGSTQSNTPSAFSPRYDAEHQGVQVAEGDAWWDEEPDVPTKKSPSNQSTLKRRAERLARRKAFKERLQLSLNLGNNLPDKWVSKKLPGEVRDIVPAYCGVAIACAIKDLKKIVLLHSISGTGVKYLNVPSTEFLMAAAERYLFVYYPSLKIVEKYDMTNATKVSAKSLKSEGLISIFAMGMDNYDTAFVSYSPQTGSSNRRSYGLLDMNTCKIHPLKPKEVARGSGSYPRNFQNSSYHDRVHASVNDTLQHLTCWCTSHTPNGYEYVTLDLRKRIHANFYDHSSYGGLTISSDGEYVFSTYGWVFQGRKKLKQFKDSRLYAVKGGSFFIRWSKENLSVCETCLLSEVRKLDLPYGKPQSGKRGRSRTHRRPSSTAARWEKMVIASALTNRISLLDPETNTIYTRPLLPAAMVNGKRAGNSLIAVPGETWTFNLMLPKGFTSGIEDAPKDLRLENGVLNWEVPTHATKGVREILISIKDSKGEENYRVIRAMVK